MAIETEHNTKPANRADFKQLFEQAKAFLQTRRGRIIACSCGAAIVLLAVILLVINAGGDRLPEGWPTGELMEGIQPPGQGSIVSVHQTEDAVTVYFAEFPAEELAAYLKLLGASPAGNSTYVTQKGEDRMLAVVYDPAAKQLSLTVTATK